MIARLKWKDRFSIREVLEKQFNQQLQQTTFLQSNRQICLCNMKDVYKGLNHQRYIQFVHPAYNQSFIVLIRKYRIHHYSKDGKLLKQIQFSQYKKQPGYIYMPNSKTLIVVCYCLLFMRSLQAIVQYNLQTYQAREMIFNKQFKIGKFSFYFQQTKLFCIISAEGPYENIQKINKQLNILCLSYPFPINEEKQPYKIYKIQLPEQINKSCFNIIKLDNRSKIALINTVLSEPNCLQIYVCDLLEEKQLSWQRYKFAYKFQFNFNICSTRIVDLCEINPCVFYVKVGVEPDSRKLKFNQLQLLQLQFFQSMEEELDFIWNYNTGHIRQLAFEANNIHYVQFIGHYKQINTFIPQKSYVKNLLKKFNKIQKLRQATILYVDPESLQVLGRQIRKILVSAQQNAQLIWPKFIPVSYNPKIFIEFYQQKPKQKIFVRVRKIRQLPFSTNIIYASMMTSIMQNPHEALVEKVLQLLSVDVYQQDLDEWKWEKE